MFLSTKTYGPELGLSACFRQWRADSHCNLLHGYALSFKLTFQCETLDDRNWVQDFGGLKEVKQHLVEMFDHKLLVAGDDPNLDVFKALNDSGIAKVIVLPDGVGCEMFAKYVFNYVSLWLKQEHEKWCRNTIAGTLTQPTLQRVFLLSVEVREHGANSAIYLGEA